MEFFPAFAAPVVSAGTSLCACNCFYCRTSGTEKAGLSGDSGAVGGKSHKGKLFFVFCGKRRLSHLLCKELSVLRTSLFLAGLLVWIQKGGSSWLSGQEENGIFAVWTSCFLEYGCYGAEVAGKAKCPGNSGRVRRNHFSGNLHLSSFYWLAEFLCGELAYQSIGKSGKRLFHAYLCSSLRGPAGLVQML